MSRNFGLLSSWLTCLPAYVSRLPKPPLFPISMSPSLFCLIFCAASPNPLLLWSLDSLAMAVFSSSYGLTPAFILKYLPSFSKTLRPCLLICFSCEPGTMPVVITTREPLTIRPCLPITFNLGTQRTGSDVSSPHSLPKWDHFICSRSLVRACQCTQIASFISQQKRHFTFYRATQQAFRVYCQALPRSRSQGQKTLLSALRSRPENHPSATQASAPVSLSPFLSSHQALEDAQKVVDWPQHQFDQ